MSKTALISFIALTGEESFTKLSFKKVGLISQFIFGMREWAIISFFTNAKIVKTAHFCLEEIMIDLIVALLVF